MQVFILNTTINQIFDYLVVILLIHPSFTGLKYNSITIHPCFVLFCFVIVYDIAKCAYFLPFW